MGSHKDHSQTLHYPFKFLRRRSAAQAESDRVLADLRTHAHRLQDRQQFNDFGVAGRARRRGHVIQRVQNLGADPPREVDVECVWQPFGWMPVEGDIGELVVEPLPEQMVPFVA
jgi:hypothetical protein